MPDLSRRTFLAITASAPLLAADEAPPGAVGPGPGKIAFTVNDAAMTANAEPRLTLLDVLREHLDVTGPRPGCHDRGCGTCTVLLDGRAVYACSVLAVEAEGRRVTTPEALVDGGAIDPVARAFADAGGAWPDVALAARAVFDGEPKPAATEVERGLAGVILPNAEAARRAIARLCPPARK